MIIYWRHFQQHIAHADKLASDKQSDLQCDFILHQWNFQQHIADANQVASDKKSEKQCDFILATAHLAGDAAYFCPDLNATCSNRFKAFVYKLPPFLGTFSLDCLD